MATTAKRVKDAKKPKFSSRKHNRCKICGRPRAFLRKFGICRLCFRGLALKGEIPGVSPLRASPRKHSRQMPKLRRSARRPQILAAVVLARRELGASLRPLLVLPYCRPCNPFLEVSKLKLELFYALNGIPRCLSRDRAWSSEPAVVTIVAFHAFQLVDPRVVDLRKSAGRWGIGVVATSIERAAGARRGNREREAGPR